MEIRTAIQKLAMQNVFETILGVVKNVDLSKYTCTVSPVDDQPDLLEVRLNALESPNKGIIPIPVVGSFVLVGQTAIETPHVLMFSELDSYQVKFDSVTFELSNEGMRLTKGTNDFKEGLSELKDALKNLKVMTSQGESSIPINVLDINNACDKILGTLQ